MTAREMFEKLGYKYHRTPQGIVCHKSYSVSYPCDEIIIYNNDFDFNNKEIRKTRIYLEKRTYINITLEELQAINKQVEELGWNNEI